MPQPQRVKPANNRVPIPFEQFVEGVLTIDPKKLSQAKGAISHPSSLGWNSP
jgi:hypothetical protein